MLLRVLSRVLSLFVALPVHEASHGLAALALGDPTAKYKGRLTLNPLKHLDPLGCIALLFFGVGWAKPVPVDTRRFKNPKLGMALVAAAGPLSNFVLAFIFMIFFKVAFYSIGRIAYQTALGIAMVLQYIIIINISIGLFNLIPCPPFDGGRIITFFLPERIYFGFMKYERYIYFAVLLLVFSGFLGKPLDAAVSGIYGWMVRATFFVDMIIA